MSSNEPAPDLASVLSILAGLTPQTQALLSQHPSSTTIAAPYQALQTPTHQPHQAQPLHPYEQTYPPAHPPRSRTPTELPPSNVRFVDPTAIIEWNSGLRCVMKTVAKHENVMLEIRRMIKNQHEHEELWFMGREALLEKQAAREEGQKKLDDVLKLVGGSITEGATDTSPEAMKRELETFDMKVHRAQAQMVKEMMNALQRMGVPFFGTRTELVKVPGKEVGNDGQGVIEEKELIKLQRKMLVILEDLCSD